MSEFSKMIKSNIVPQVTKNYENDGILHFIVEDVPICIANGLRRTIISDIPVVVVRTENSKINQAQVQTNTSRFHNEIIKQRLSCIPFITQDLEELPEHYRLVVEKKNSNDYELEFVTTDDFRIQHKESGQFLQETEMRKILPHDPISNRPIDFLRLRPKMGPTIPGEAIQLTAEFSVSTAAENGMFNAVSKCTYFNVIDPEKRSTSWSHYLQKYKDDNRTNEEIAFEEKNFGYLDAQRCYKTDDMDQANAFEFAIKTIGQYSNYELVMKGCQILKNKLDAFQKSVASDTVPIHQSDQSKELGYTSVIVANINAYDIILENEDYTLGYILEHFLYILFYSSSSASGDSTPELSFIGFKKYHPHDEYSVLRLMSKRFKLEDDAASITYVKQYLIQSCTEAMDVLETLRKKFIR